MKTAIIFIFHNNEKSIDKDFFIEYLNKSQCLEFCFVNNDSKDKTYQVLNEIMGQCKNVSVVNIRKHKTDISAVRAGIRFMINQFNLEKIGYAYSKIVSYKQTELNNIIQLIIENQNCIVSYKNTAIQIKGLNQTLFQSIFSLSDYMRDYQLKPKFINIRN